MARATKDNDNNEPPRVVASDHCYYRRYPVLREQPNVKVHRARAIKPAEAEVCVARAPVQPLVRQIFESTSRFLQRQVAYSLVLPPTYQAGELVGREVGDGQ
jgi:hypothetical protein